MLTSEKMDTKILKQQIKQLREQRGFCDLLTYLIQWNKNLVLHKDFSFSKHYDYFPPDLSTVSDKEYDYHAEVWKNALHILGNGWMLETQVISKKFQPPSFFESDSPEYVSNLINKERYKQYQKGEYYDTVYRLSLSWKPTSQTVHRLKSFTLNDSNKVENQYLNSILEQFEKKGNEFIDYLKKSVGRIEALADTDLLSFLHHCITGEAKSLAKLNMGSFLDTYLATEDFLGGFAPMIGKNKIAALTLDELPSYSYPCILSEINQLPFEYRWSTRYIALDNMTARLYLKRHEKNWSSKAIGLVGVIRESLGMPNKLDAYAQSNVEELIHAQTDNTSGKIAHGFYNSVIVLMHEKQDILDQRSNEVSTIIQKANYKVRRERVNSCEAYLGSIPGHGDYNLRKMLVDSQYVSHALPITKLYQGEWRSPSSMCGYLNKQPLLLGTIEKSLPFALNIHVDDVGHTAVLGPTGSGKSTLIGALMVSHRQYSGSRIIVFDKDYSNKLVIKALGGEYYDLTECKCQFSPLARINLDNPITIDEAVNWLMECCYLQKLELKPHQKQALVNAVERLSKEDGIYKNLNHLSVQDPEVRIALNAFNTGAIQLLLNGTSTNNFDNDVIGFNMGDLIANNQTGNSSAIAVIKAIFNQLMVKFADQRPTLLILEEAWLYLQHPVFLNQLTDWFKTLRKGNVAVIFISQDLHDIVQSPAASTIQSSCMTRIYCPNKSASENHVSKQYYSFGLNDRQITKIAQSIPKRDYFYQSSYGSALFQLDLKSIAKAFFCVGDKHQQQMFEKFYNMADTKWVEEWLKFYNVKERHDGQ